MVSTIKIQTCYSQLCRASLVVFGVIFTSQFEPAFAQVTSDNTLPKNSQVRQQGNIYNITGGTQAGSKVFHSFA
ncbi:MAG: hypothetical protein ACFB2X_10455 [Rivularia sp. (in: cyanobacteria)]